MSRLILMSSLLWLLVLAPSGPHAAAADAVKMLVIDETQTLTESLAVNAMVAMTRRSGLPVEVDAVAVTVRSPFDVPLRQNPNNKRYDVIVVIPLGVTQVRQVWVVTRPYPQREPAVWEMIGTIRKQAAQFANQFPVKILTVNDDLWPAILSSIFQRLGLL